MSQSENLSREDLEALDRDKLVEVVLEQSAKIDALRTEVRSQEARMDALGDQISTIKEAIAGDVDGFSAWSDSDPDPIVDRLESVDETLASHADRLEMVPSGTLDKPDDRAVRLRQVLAGRLSRSDTINDETARLERDNARDALGGDLHKDRVLDAMRRAADGREADIDGSSTLDPVDAISFHVGSAVGLSGEPKQSYLEIDAADLTDWDARQNLTTVGGGGGR